MSTLFAARPALLRRCCRSSRSTAPALSVRAMATAGGVPSIIASNPVVVFSKTYCPYCTAVKALFSNMDVKPLVLELDKIAEGDTLSAELQKLTGQRTFPNVFVGGKHIGGNDSTQALHRSGGLAPALRAAGVEPKL